MNRIRIVVTILALLFACSFFVQTKTFKRIANKSEFEFVKYDNENTWLKVHEFWGLEMRFVDILIVISLSLISTMIILLLIILVKRNNRDNREKLKDELMEKYQLMILEYLGASTVNMEGFKKMTRSKFNRQILIKQIIDISLNLPPEAKLKLNKLYFFLGLLKDTKGKLDSLKWHKKVQAFKELSSLNIKVYNKKIEKCINSKNDILRLESHIALVKLADDGNPFEFLGDLDYHFSLWEQITLHQLMTENEMNVPNFGKWVNSKNLDVAMFCLRMIREYNQVNNYDELDQALLHENEKVRKTAIEVIGDLGLFSLFRVLKKRYKHETYDNSLEIIRTMGKRPVKSVMNFLQNVVDAEDDVNLQIEAVKSIKNMGDDGKVRLEKMMNSDYKNYSIIIKHVLDDRIN